MEDRIRAEGQNREVEERRVMESPGAGEAGSLVGESPVGPHSRLVREEVGLASPTEVLAKVAVAERVAAAVGEDRFGKPRSASPYARSCMLLV